MQKTLNKFVGKELPLLGSSSQTFNLPLHSIMEAPNFVRGKGPTPNLAIMRNVQTSSTTSPNSSSPEKDSSDDDSINQQYERASAFRSTMEDVKKRLKTKRGYEGAGIV